MKKLLYLIAMAAVVMLMPALSACSDEKDVPKTPENDSELPSFDENFKALLENKIWEENPAKNLWMTESGKLVSGDELEPIAGAAHKDAYYFSGDKVTFFMLHTFGPAPKDVSRRWDHAYTLDKTTGTIIFSKSGDNTLKPIIIESLTENELVIRTDFGQRAKYRRCVLTPVAKSEEKAWWNEYVDYTNK